MPPSAGSVVPEGGLRDASKLINLDIKRLSALHEAKDPNPYDINLRLSKLRSRSGSIIVEDSKHAVEIKLEEAVWGWHSKTNGWYKKRLKQLDNGKKPVEERKLSKRYLEFIKSAQNFYRDLIRQLDVHYGGIPELNAIADKVPLEKFEIAQAEARSSVLDLCFYALIRLGDLSRWREQRRADAKTNWAPAIGYYDLASTLRPNSGIPHNQLAVIAAASKDDNLRVIYHFYRALTAPEPHPTAEANLNLEFKKIMATPAPHLNRDSHRQKPESEAQTLHDLVYWFNQLHAKCVNAPVLSEQEDLEKRVLGYLCVNIKEISMSWLLIQLVLVNLLAEHAATRKVEANLEPTKFNQHVQTRSYFMKLNIRFFTAILRLLQTDVVEGLNTTGWVAKSPTDRMQPVMRQVLPSIRLYSCWLLWSLPTLTQPLEEGPFQDSFQHDLKAMWSAYTRALDALVNAFAASELAAVDYLLEEDSEAIGFTPFQTPIVMSRFLEQGRFRKPDRHNVSRSHPNKEMLARIRDLVSDGMKLTEMKNCPITVSYRADGRPVFKFEFTTMPRSPAVRHSRGMSIASSSRASSRGQIMSPVPRPLVGQRPLSPDTIMRERAEQMVDDLVGPDTTPQKPLFNYSRFQTLVPCTSYRPKTPPSHSFEDPSFDINPFSPASVPGYEKLAHSQAMQWLNGALQAGQLEGRLPERNPNDPLSDFYHVTH